MFDNLNEIYNEIINLIQNNKPNLIEENNKLLLSIPISITKIKEIILEINKKEKSEKEKFEDLYLMINNLKLYYNNEITQQVNNLKLYYDNKINEITQQTNIKIEKQNNIINELNKKIEKQNEQLTELHQKLEENKLILNLINPNIFNDSLIIKKNIIYISYLKRWISPNDQLFTTKLLFRSSENGNSYEEFHRLCDNQGKTLVLIQGKEGFIIGGYTTKDWNTTGDWTKDENFFFH